MTTQALTVEQAADWFIENFGMDLPEGDSWYWVEDIHSVEEIPPRCYLVAGVTGLEGICEGGGG